MSYNERVSKAMKSVGKETSKAYMKNLEIGREKMLADLERIKTVRTQYIYGRFLDRGSWTKKELKELTDASEHIIVDILRNLEDSQLIYSEIFDCQYRVKTYTICDDKHIPEGWPAKGELIMMKCPFHKTVPKKKRTEQEKAESKIINNPMTKMLRNLDEHVEDVSPYKQLLEDTKRFYGKEELDDLISAIHNICKIRIEQQYIACPLCKGRIQRNMSEAVCTKCGAKINGGTFEKSMEMLKVLAKAGVTMS